MSRESNTGAHTADINNIVYWHPLYLINIIFDAHAAVIVNCMYWQCSDQRCTSAGPAGSVQDVTLHCQHVTHWLATQSVLILLRTIGGRLTSRSVMSARLLTEAEKGLDGCLDIISLPMYGLLRLSGHCCHCCCDWYGIP